MIVTLALALLAGALSTLSPCVLPLLPIVIGASAARHRAGPVALALGLSLSFVTVGLLVATVGQSLGLDAALFRTVAAVAMILAGLTLLSPALTEKVAVAAGPVATWAAGRSASVDDSGLSGQFMIGVLLGAVWSPCAGPTLGAASVLAAQGKDLPAVAGTMLSFGIGAALPLLLLGLASRETMLAWRGRLVSAGDGLKMVLGGALAVIGLVVLTGLDKALEAALVAVLPDWLVVLTTRF